MDAHFSLIDKDGSRIGEQTLRADAGLAAALMANPGIAEGVLSIEDAQTEVRASLGDTLPVLIGRFCQSGLADLREKGALEVDFFDHEEILKITVADGQVHFDSTRFGQRSFPRDDYFAALAACGERFEALMSSLPEPPESE